MNTKTILSHSWNRLLILEILFLVLVIQVIFTPVPPQKVIAIPKTNDRNPEVTADWGDVVDVNYSLWEDEQHTIEKENNIDVDLVYIYLRRNINVLVPTKVYNAFPPEAKDYLDQLYFQDFINAIIGMKVDQDKEFMIPAENVDSDTDLYYKVRLLSILYDASEQPEPSERSPNPFQDLFSLLLIGGAVAGIGGGFIIWRVQTARTYKSALSEEKTGDIMREKAIQKDKSQIKELRNLTESIAGSEETSKKTEVKFRSRRR